MEKNNSLALHKIYKNFTQAGKTFTVLKNTSVQFEQKNTYAITGVSGSGKSTLLHILGGLDVPSSGSVMFNNQDINLFSTHKKNIFLQSSVGFVFQHHYLIKELSALENVLLPALIKGDGSMSVYQSRARELLDMVGLSDRVDYFPAQLSGGQLQRVSIARALMNQPAFVIADEPTGSLDADNAAMVVALLRSVHTQWGIGIILCSHDPAVFTQMSTIYHIDQGTLNLEK